MYKKLDDEDINQILVLAGLGKASRIRKSLVGFSNDIYFIDDAYVLKAGKSEPDRESLRRELYFCNLLKGKLPAPVVVFSDLSSKHTERPFIIYEKIHGDNLYNKWHDLNEEKRKKIVGQICAYLKLINSLPPEDFIKTFQIDTAKSWHDQIFSQIETHLNNSIKKGLIADDLVTKVKEYVASKQHVLNEARMAITYFDPHFDNFIVQDEKIVGVVDFERTDYLSTDYVLDVVKRMVEYPTKYASEESEKYIKKEDYKNLLSWYREFYPELFEFKELNMRLDLYAIKYILKMLGLFPNDDRARKELEAILN